MIYQHLLIKINVEPIFTKMNCTLKPWITFKIFIELYHYQEK